MEVCLIRHTTPQIAKGICYGQTDLELADSYPFELQAIMKETDQMQFDQIYSSPLKRCKALATDLFTDKAIIFDKRIMEYHFGEWEMVAWNDMEQGEQEKWMADYVNIPAPGGESLLDMKKRVADFLEEITRSKYRSVALVTHSGVIRIISAIVEQTDLARCFDYQLPYGVIKRFSI
ncbi:MAG: alpha-ribazole phosphatase [Cyclobacteriaceae bacterium]